MPAWPTAARQGGSVLWWWMAPVPLQYAVVQQVTFTSPSGAVLLTANLTQTWSDAVASISAIADDRQTLTVNGSIPSAARLASGMRAEAWILGSSGYVPVRVVRLAATSAVLAEPLPRDVGSTGTLHAAWWSCALSAGDVLATVQRGVTWSVSYYAIDTGPLAGAYLGRDTGILDVVRQPFDTGLSTEDLVSLLDPGGSRVPARAQGYEAAIRASYEELVATLRADSPQGLDQHDLNGPEIRPVHRFIAAAYLARTADERTEYRARAAVLWDRIRLTCWANAARNGLATDAERRHPITWVGGTFSPSTAARRTWEDVD